MFISGCKRRTVFAKEFEFMVGVSVTVRITCRSGVSATGLMMSLISCVLNADSGRYAEALLSYTDTVVFDYSHLTKPLSYIKATYI